MIILHFIIVFLLLNNYSFTMEENIKEEYVNIESNVITDKSDILNEEEQKKAIKINKLNQIQEAKIAIALKNFNTYKACELDKKPTNTNEKLKSNEQKNQMSFMEEYRMKSELEQNLLANGVSEKTTSKIIKSLRYIETVVTEKNNQPELKNDFSSYLSKYKLNDKTKEAKIYEVLYKNQFEEIEKIFKMNPQILLALWGAESNFGKVQGNFRALDVLYTQSFSNRKEFYKNNLIILAKLIDNGIFGYDIKSSWAGAIGNCQFMPTAYYNFAISLKNEKIDIVNSPIDALTSAANYLYNTGWKKNEGILTEISIEEGYDRCLIGFNNRKTIKEWQNLGFKPLENGIGQQYAKNEDQEVSIIMPDINDESIPLEKKRAFFAYDNFKVILGWNKSTIYATMIGIFVDMIEKEKIQKTNSEGFVSKR